MPVLYVVTIELHPDVVAAFRDWYPPHVEEVLAQPGFIRCDRYADTEDAKDGWKRVHAHYLLQSRDAFERYTQSDAAARLRADSRQKFGDKARFQRALYDEDGSWTAAPTARGA